MCIYKYIMEYYSAMKKDTLPFATAWMNLEGIMLSEISQREKDKYYTISHVASKKSKCIETDTETIVTKGWGWGGEKKMGAVVIK